MVLSSQNEGFAVKCVLVTCCLSACQAFYGHRSGVPKPAGLLFQSLVFYKGRCLGSYHACVIN